MDIQRILLLLGLGVTAYLLILAWNDDYGQGRSIEEQKITTNKGSVRNTGEGSGETRANNAEITTLDGARSVGNDVPVNNPAGVVPVLETAPAANTINPARGREKTLIHVTTDLFEIDIDLYGGDIVRVALPQFPATLDTPDIPFLLIDPRNFYEAQSGLIGPNATDNADTRPTFVAGQTTYELGDRDELKVALTFRQANGVRIVKNFHFRRGDYLLRVEYEINNTTNTVWQGALYTQIKRDSQKPVNTHENFMGLQPFVGGATRSENELYTKLEFEDIAEMPYRADIGEGYMAMVQHYFVSAWIPEEQAGNNTYEARKLAGQDVYLLGIKTPLISIAAGDSGKLSARFYAGPKDQYRLEEITKGLNLTVDYGFLWWLAQPLFYLLTSLHDVFGNWGFAIIILTIIIKIVLYPLSAASFRSVARMRKLQPEMQRLKERHEGDTQKRSEAMMNLYKKEGVNPLGGCLPMLLQMPVFLALYWTLMESVELRQAPFVLWIHDLSAMDPYFILPILMGISMYLTQLMNPEPPDPIQAKVFKFMPIMFTFFFLWFPSGLVLYWLVNNLLTFMQQYYVTHKIEKGEARNT